ncbi:UPF0187-domain-containing protein [Cylindrobasidium torrendii FP15055 ss-10]|uniref:UPF0187-domain-containing protein n=1 Tax=Cylindrobasidium torrendii FP15055 ss-10 TaxID=1314674 RepID=A0A0D7BSI7_9AGAR|nr:UPF0187-domain-containing protein [Cylindrobasidium torrendii FP15055 ss-10]
MQSNNGMAPPRLSREGSFSHKGFSVPDPFAPRQGPSSNFLNALLATALFRCWHIIIFFSAWSAMVTLLNNHGYHASFQPTLITVVGTVLGFVISYRTTSSFERYNEGRRLWSQIILASRTFSRTTWFHVPDAPPAGDETLNHARARSLIEKKSVVNLLEAYAVAVKHYLRGEDGIYYTDLYYLVKFLPAYALPAGIPSQVDLTQVNLAEPQGTNGAALESVQSATSGSASDGTFLHQRTSITSNEKDPNMSSTTLPLPVTSPRSPRRMNFLEPIRSRDGPPASKIILAKDDEGLLLPAAMPPKYHLFDLFPFSLLTKLLTKRGKEMKGKKAARLRAKIKSEHQSHNLPLEVSLYLSSYISSLQVRKIADVPTTNTLIAALNQLVDSLTGLERILTTPIPFSYSFHLWSVCVLYNLFLPFQVWSALGWVTIPASSVLAFIFFGFLVAGEEIENPFGYDKNDLNMDHFTNNIIRNELRAITSSAPPDPTHWAFVQENDLLFAGDAKDARVTPAEWMKRGYGSMMAATSGY